MAPEKISTGMWLLPYHEQQSARSNNPSAAAWSLTPELQSRRAQACALVVRMLWPLINSADM
eukprot:4809628-Pleurochrysis_carterae.AAC.3